MVRESMRIRRDRYPSSKGKRKSKMGVVSSIRCQREVKIPVESYKHRYASLDMDTRMPSPLITGMMKLRNTLYGEVCGHLFLGLTFQS